MLQVTNNRQRTSRGRGIVKVEVVLRCATILYEHGIRTVHDARALRDDALRLEAVKLSLRTVPGEGGFEVRRGYLWMLIGDERTIEPDRMALR